MNSPNAGTDFKENILLLALNCGVPNLLEDPEDMMQRMQPDATGLCARRMEGRGIVGCRRFFTTLGTYIGNPQDEMWMHGST